MKEKNVIEIREFDELVAFDNLVRNLFSQTDISLETLSKDLIRNAEKSFNLVRKVVNLHKKRVLEIQEKIDELNEAKKSWQSVQNDYSDKIIKGDEWTNMTGFYNREIDDIKKQISDLKNSNIVIK